MHHRPATVGEEDSRESYHVYLSRYARVFCGTGELNASFHLQPLLFSPGASVSSQVPEDEEGLVARPLLERESEYR